MANQVQIKNRHGKIVGTLIEQSNGNVELCKETGAYRIATYHKSSDVTRQGTCGLIIGKGNLLLTMLDMQQ